jgi:hypothetical protein
MDINFHNVLIRVHRPNLYAVCSVDRISLWEEVSCQILGTVRAYICYKSTRQGTRVLLILVSLIVVSTDSLHYARILSSWHMN